MVNDTENKWFLLHAIWVIPVLIIFTALYTLGLALFITSRILRWLAGLFSLPGYYLLDLDDLRE
jgi:ATP/ADP translocase